MVISTDKLIQEFYNSIKEEYPELSYERVEKICKMPFYYIRNIIECSSFSILHIKYLGKFLVYPGKVKSYLKTYNTKLKNQIIDAQEYESKTKHLKQFLINNNEEIPDTDS